jgi:DNA-binding transcriptional LysR family regulator
MNWEDIKIFLEVARAERLSVAAKRLNLDASTVSRRLHKLEQSLSAKLFERTVDGHQLTEQGERLLLSARKMEHDANDVFDDLRHHQQINSGIVRIGVTEAFGNAFIAPNLLELQQQFPKIQIDLLHFSRSVKISRNEADIAITVEKPNSTSMIITKLCDYTLQLYAHPDYLAKLSSEITWQNLTHQQWVSYVDNLLFTEQLSYLKEINEQVTPNFRSTSVVSQYSAVKSGLGVGILPCFLAEQDASLVKLFANDINIVRSFYLVTHPESKRLSRVATVWDYLKKLASDKHNLLMPE